ncbi:MAG: ABC transporter permease, partial [Holophagales bacterium]|nr:ABC transporter permease [Holophagales bacterium]
MDTFWRLLKAEREKLRRSSCIRMVWFLPLLFILAEFFVFEYKLFGITNVSDELLKIVDSAQIKMAGALWGGFFYPVLIALLPALIFRAEHRNKTWRRLGAMPVTAAQVFAAKTVWVVVLSLASLITVWFLLWVTRSVLHFAAPQIQLSFHGWAIAAVLGWLWLGSLPVMAIYLWISNRI